MSIFRREQESDQPTSAASTGAAAGTGPSRAATAGSRGQTKIAAGTRVEGAIGGGADLLIEGEVDGRIELDSAIVVGSGGAVVGEIMARSVTIGGKVHGDVSGREKVEILASGRVEGDVKAPRVVISEGAFFKGRVEMTGGGAAARRATGGERQTSAAPPATGGADAGDGGAS